MNRSNNSVDDEIYNCNADTICSNIDDLFDHANPPHHSSKAGLTTMSLRRRRTKQESAAEAFIQFGAKSESMTLSETTKTSRFVNTVALRTVFET